MASILVWRAQRFFRKAQSEVQVLNPYLVPGEPFFAEAQRLEERGVNMAIMTNSLGSTNQPIVHAAYPRTRLPMLRAGVDVYEMKYKGGMQQELDVPPITSSLCEPACGGTVVHPHRKTHLPTAFGSPYDDAVFVPTFAPHPNGVPDNFVYTGIELDNGNLSVEVNDGANGNNWVKIETVGSVGITPLGGVNRDGLGATVSFTPRNGQTTLVPVISGGSHASSHSDIAHFGLGSAERGTVNVLWPGGVRNRLYNATKNRQYTFPEIPCSVDTTDGFRRVFPLCPELAQGHRVRGHRQSSREGGALRQRDHRLSRRALMSAAGRSSGGRFDHSPGWTSAAHWSVGASFSNTTTVSSMNGWPSKS